MTLVLQNESELFGLKNNLNQEQMDALKQDLVGEFDYAYYYDEFNQLTLRQPRKQCRVLLKLFKLDIIPVFSSAECRELSNLLSGIETVNTNDYLNTFKDYLDVADSKGCKLYISGASEIFYE